jgi:hypothetical protein
VSVQVDAQGRPTAVSKVGERGTDNECLDPECRPIAEILETWHIDDEWWRDPIHRRYAEVVFEDGAHVVLFEDLATNTWYLQKP